MTICLYSIQPQYITHDIKNKDIIKLNDRKAEELS